MPVDDRRIDRDVLLPVALKHRAILKCDPDKWTDAEIQKIIDDCGLQFRTMPVQNARLSCIALRKAGLLGKVDDVPQLSNGHVIASPLPFAESADIGKVYDDSHPPKLSDMPLAEKWQRQCLITPECAALALSLNIGNRRLRKAFVGHLVRHIKEGKWQSDHPDPIMFSEMGRMINGQHRINAVVLSGESVVAYCAGGVREELREYLDTGCSRSLDDRVEFHDDQFVNHRCAALVNGLYTIRYFIGSEGGKFKNCKPTPTEAKRLFDEHSEAITHLARKWSASIKGIRQAPVMCAFIALYERDPVLCDNFWDSMHSVDGNIQPARALRDWLIRYAGPKRGYSRVTDLYAKTLYAMRAAIDGRSITSLRNSGYEL